MSAQKAVPHDRKRKGGAVAMPFPEPAPKAPDPSPGALRRRPALMLAAESWGPEPGERRPPLKAPHLGPCRCFRCQDVREENERIGRGA